MYEYKLQNSQVFDRAIHWPVCQKWEGVCLAFFAGLAVVDHLWFGDFKVVEPIVACLIGI